MRTRSDGWDSPGRGRARAVALLVPLLPLLTFGPARAQDAPAATRATPASAQEQTVNGRSLREWLRLLEEGEPRERADAAAIMDSAAFRPYDHFPAARAALLRSAKDPVWLVRREAVAALGGLHRLADRPPNPETIAALTRALRDDSPPVREAAALSLGRLGCEAALRPLLGALEESDRAELCQLLESIAWIGLPLEDAAPAPVTAALDDPDSRVRLLAARALFKLTGETERPIAVMVAVLLSEATPAELRERAGAFLGEVGPAAAAAARAPLLAVLRSGEEPDGVRCMAAGALARQGAAAGEETVDALVELLDTSSNRLAQTLVYALAHLGIQGVARDRAVGGLGVVLREWPDRRVARYAAAELRRLVEAVPERTEALEAVLEWAATRGDEEIQKEARFARRLLGLEPAGTLRARVLGSGGRPLERAVVCLRDLQTGTTVFGSLAWTGPDGWAEIRGMIPGTYQVYAGREIAQVEVTLEDGAVASVVLSR